MTLFRKILLAMLLLSLLPFLISAAILFFNLEEMRGKLAQQISAAADFQASENLQQRAVQVAENISKFLSDCEEDLRLVARLPQDEPTLTAFYRSRTGEIWRRNGKGDQPPEIRGRLPRYSSLTIVDRTGTERFAIRDGQIVPPGGLRNISDPADTEFRSEDYFLRTRNLKPGEVYVSHLNGFHISKQEQLAGAVDPESAVGGKEYRGVIRFATPRFDARGRFDGIVVLSLDHRHLMEFSQHILPGIKGETVFPSYKSGNYAFIFDDEGWIITHPKFWDIRGVDARGKLIPPYSSQSSPADVAAGRIPYNLDHAGFVHPNYPVVARTVREKRSGHVDITNVGGAQKVMAFAPILYSTGDYARYGIFGAVTIGFQVDQFHEMARTGVSLITGQILEHVRQSGLIVGVTALLVLLAAWFLSRGITRPLAMLTEGARRMAEGGDSGPVEVRTGDELGKLAGSFNKMAEQLEQRKNSLLEMLEKLSLSRQEILDERNFKESVLESISSCIMTVSPDGAVTSINGTGRVLFRRGSDESLHYATLFDGWGDLSHRVALVLSGRKGYGREPLVLQNGPYQEFYEVGFFPIGSDAGKGITVTVRDETEKERMREEMTRMDRFASLGKLSAGIAHEVRNPLTGVSLLLDDLHDHAGLDQESRALMRKALAEIERVEKLIAALLNFSSPTKAEFRDADLNAVVQDTLLLMKRECEKRGVQLHLMPGEVPSFRFDSEKMKQVLLNLVKNALEALEKGGMIEVSTSAEEGSAVIVVTDNGPGISAENIPFIFEPFFTRKGAGTGLGLSITQRIVIEHGGRIAVASEEGVGTSFTVVLPLGQDIKNSP